MKFFIYLLFIFCFIYLTFPIFGQNSCPNNFPIITTFTNKNIIDDNLDGARRVYATDIDGDGNADVLGAGFDEIVWFENDGNAGFTKHTIDDNFTNVFGIHAADVDGDGDIDVLGAALSLDEIAWWENDGNEAFTKHIITDDFDGATNIYAADVNDDGDTDVLATAGFANEIAWWENDGNEAFTKHIIATNFEGATSVYPIDLDDDGDVDILGTATSGDKITWWENDGNEVFTKHSIDDNFEGAISVHATDVDGDGDMDVLGAAQLGSAIIWWENDGNEVFTKHPIDENFNNAQSVYAIDVDNDGDIDVLGASVSSAIAWWENDGNEGFTKHLIDENFDNARSVYATDIDSDGKIDILGAASNSTSIDEISWWNNELNPAPLTSSDADNSISEGESVTFSYSGGNNYDFFINNVLQQNSSSNSFTTTNLQDNDEVKVTVSNDNGCSQTSPVTVMTVTVPLSVDWSYFSVKNIDNHAITLSWQVEDEIGTSHYKIERSATGKAFAIIGKVNTNGHSSYHFFDKNPLRGANYYRIKEVENSGRFSFSETQFIHLKTMTTPLLAYPNPTADVIHLPLTETENAILILIDAQGKTILQQKWSPEVDLSKLPNGVYLLQLKTANHNYQQRIIKQK